MDTLYVNSTGQADLLAREQAMRMNLINGSADRTGFKKEQVFDHTLSAATALKNGTNNYVIDFGHDANDRDASLQLLSKDDMFFPVGASLRAGKAPVINGEVQYSMMQWVTYPSAVLFAGAANADGVTEADCIRALLHGSKTDWKAGSEEIIYEYLSEMLTYTPDTQLDAAANLLPSTGAANDLDRFRLLNKPFGFVGGKRNRVTINIPSAITSNLEDAAPTKFMNFVGIQLHGVIVRGGADSAYANAKTACCLS